MVGWPHRGQKLLKGPVVGAWAVPQWPAMRSLEPGPLSWPQDDPCWYTWDSFMSPPSRYGVLPPVGSHYYAREPRHTQPAFLEVQVRWAA